MIGSIAGLLPDLDSDTGKPLTFLFQFMAILLPSIFFFKAARFGGNSPEFLICYFTLSYLFIYYLLGSLIKKMTIHRGMMHSLPFALLCGGLGYLLFISSGQKMAFISGIALFSGCLIHLVLDELNSFTLKYGFIPVLKKSSGTALKLKSKSFADTIFVYSLLLLVFLAIFLQSI